MTTSKIRVALLDDHTVLLESLAARIDQQPDMEVVSACGNGDDALREILETKPDVAILDVELPGRGSFDIAAELRSRIKSTRLLFLSGYLSDVLLDQALRLKANGYLMKGEASETVLNAIRLVVQGKTCFSKQVEERIQFDESSKKFVLLTEHPLTSLTTRQLEVLRHLAKGESVKEVAKIMHLSQKSVDSHKYRIMHKLGIHDRVELARYAIREGLMLP